ncbi:outer membrane protein assembly factor BamD [Rhodobaculum claviforme]|uniref:Outer membrane protein assembly factor BamD n=1 Tax=Rhodobaculum claviforme TaxID=1549854 RepID=A0A934TMS2_9RHOB|nr:outer membrane protein assembly factor BamD [Rhodobaculum claviforme]MBK5928660.1 outer membrane protein assembly factor BamD [Rhodobaculum claviforme]
MARRGAAGHGLVALALAGLLLTGCGGTGSSGDALNLEGVPAEEIFRRGEFELETSRRATDAIRYFSEVERLYPYSRFARRALVMQAYALHRERNYEEARTVAQRFLDTYPGDEDAAWAQYLIALSFYDQIEDVGRDQGLTFQALRALRDVIERHPDSEYARSSVLKFDLAFDHLAGKEMEVGRFYLRQRQYAAAINRFRVVVEDFETTTHTPEALHRLVESYLALGLTEEARTAGAILGHNFQGNPFYDDSFRLLTGQGLAPDAAGEGWLRDLYRQAVRGDWL